MVISASDQFLGQTLGRYSVEQLVGRGRLSDVYAVRHVVRGDIAALMAFHLPGHYAEEEKARFSARFQAVNLASLRQRYILPVLAMGMYADKPYLVTPYMTNGSLVTHIAQKTHLSFAETAMLLKHIGAGLAFVHGQGIVHGMLHPGMLLLDEQGSWLLSGPGLREIVQMPGILRREPAHSYWYDVTGVPLFPPAYMSPEQLQGLPPSISSDIYSLGALLVYALSGKAPYHGVTPETVLMELRTQPFSAQALFKASALASVIERALHYDPARRFPDVATFVAACLDVLERSTAQALPREGAISLPQEKRFVSFVGEPQDWQFLTDYQPSVNKLLQDTEPLNQPRRRQSKTQKVSRRQVVALLATGGVAASVAGVVGWNSMRQQVPKQAVAKTQVAMTAPAQPLPANAVGKTSLAVNSSKTFQNPKDQNASLLIHLPDNKLVAYERLCTHTDVYVNYDPATHTLICPAHGAIFDPAQKGKVLQGPAKKPLPAVAIQVNPDGTVVAV